MIGTIIYRDQWTRTSENRKMSKGDDEMKEAIIKYRILDKDGQEIRPIEHYTKVIPRKGDKYKDISGTFLVEDVIHEGIFSDSGVHTITVKLMEL